MKDKGIPKETVEDDLEDRGKVDAASYDPRTPNIEDDKKANQDDVEAKDTANKDLIKPEDNMNSPNVNVHTLTINQSNTIDHQGVEDQNVNG